MQKLDDEGGSLGEQHRGSGPLVALDEKAHGVGQGTMTLTLEGGLVLIDGTSAGAVSNPTDAALRLAQARRAKMDLWSQTHPEPGRTRPDFGFILVAFSQADPWSNVAGTLEAAATAGFTHAALLFDGRNQLAPPPPTRVSRFWQDWNHDVQLGRSNVATPPRIYDRCPEVGEALQGMAEQAMSGEEKAAEFERRIPDGIEKCGCQVDFDEVKGWDWAYHGRYDSGRPQVERDVSIAPRSQPGVALLVEPPEAPWRDVYQRVLAASGVGQPLAFQAAN
jgi:hypothetical protein